MSNLLEIKLKDIDSVPVVLLKGNEIDNKVCVEFKWETADENGKKAPIINITHATGRLLNNITVNTDEESKYKNLLNNYARALIDNEKFVDDLLYRIETINVAIRRHNDAEILRQLEMVRKAVGKYL